MPGERSLYCKIQVVLDYAKQGNHTNLATLVNIIHTHVPVNFVHYWRDRTTDKVKYKCSEDSIEETVDLCVDLGLLNKDNLKMSKRGLNATDPRRYALILGASAEELLAKYGITLSMIYSSIMTLLHGEHATPPTVDEIWHHLNPAENRIKFNKFRQLMGLFGYCGVLRMLQKRIYLPASI